MACPAPITNIRNVGSAYWRPWLAPEFRCLVPATAFCEYTSGRPAVPHWFALSADRPLFAFAGLWRPWRGTRGPKSDPVQGEHDLFAFLTCAPNEVVGPIHPKAMPVLLTTPEECDAWLGAPDPLFLQRPLPSPLLQIVAVGEKQDPPTRPASAPPQAPPPAQGLLF